MKKGQKTLLGALGILGGIVLYGFVHLSTVIYMPSMTGWSTPPGRYFTALSESGGTFPLIVCGALVIISLFLIYLDYNQLDEYGDSVKDSSERVL